MDNDIDPPSFLEEDEDNYKTNINDNNIITGIPIFEQQSHSKNNKVEKNSEKISAKNKITINAVDKKKTAMNNISNMVNNKNSFKELESK